METAVIEFLFSALAQLAAQYPDVSHVFICSHEFYCFYRASNE